MYGQLVSVDAPHFNAGLILGWGQVLDAAPILRWTINKPWSYVQAYFDRKGYKYEILNEKPQDA